MKLIRTTMRKGKAVHTVEMEPGEKLVAVRPDAFYRLGEPLDDVVPGHVIEHPQRVAWCPVEQNWRGA